MGNRDTLINIDELREGMVVGKEIIVNGNVLVAKGTRITSSIIKKLRDVYLENDIIVKNREVAKEVIIETARETVKETVKVDYKKELEEVRRTVKNFSYHLENMFDKIKLNGRADISEVRRFSKKIIDELTSPDIIIKNIVMEGSKEDCIFRHSVNVAALSLLLGGWVGFAKEELNLLLYSAVLHDFGKTKLNHNKICRASEATYGEEKIKNHPVISYNLVKDITYLSKSVKYGIAMHHERLDGTGYPLGLKDEGIHKFARIIAIADTFDDISSNRFNEKNVNPLKSLEIMKNESLGKLDYNYCNIFIEKIINYYIGEKVLLSNKKVGKIVQIDINNLSCPLLFCDDEFIDLKKHKDIKIKGFVINQ